MNSVDVGISRSEVVLTMTSLITQPRTIVLQKPKKIFGSFLVNKDSNTPYSDATKVMTKYNYKMALLINSDAAGNND